MTEMGLIIRLPGQEVADTKLVDKVVAEVNEAWQEGGVRTMRHIGKIVLDRMFGADLDNFAAQADRHKSFRALSKSKELKFSNSHLWYAVALQDPARVFGPMAAQLSESVQRRLVHVKDAESRAELAQRAAVEGLSVKAVEGLIRERREVAAGKKRGRPGLPAAVKDFRRLRGAVRKLGTAAIGPGDGVGAVEAAAMVAEIRAVRMRMVAWLEEFEVGIGMGARVEE